MNHREFRSASGRFALLAAAALLVVSTFTEAAHARVVRMRKVGTWNLNLRVGETADAALPFLATDFRVLALQGVTLPETESTPTAAVDSVAELIEAVRPWYKHAYYVPPRPQSYNIGCAPVLPEEICAYVNMPGTNCVPIIGGAMLQCLDSVGKDLATTRVADFLDSPCAVYAAGLLSVDTMCLACLANAGQENGGDNDATLATCFAQQGPRLTDRGSAGQLILSKRRISDVSVVEYFSYDGATANIYATISRRRFGFVAFPKDLLADAGLTGVIPPLPGSLQPQMTGDLLASDADAIVGSFHSGPSHQSTAYDTLLTAYDDVAPGQSTYCTPAMAAALDPRCVIASIAKSPLPIDHVLFRTDRTSCSGTTTTGLFNDASGVSDHAGLVACTP